MFMPKLIANPGDVMATHVSASVNLHFKYVGLTAQERTCAAQLVLWGSNNGR